MTADIDLVFRGSDPQRRFSIERVFGDVADALSSSLQIRRLDLPRPGIGVADLVANIRAMRSADAPVVHLTGDVHYALLAVRRRTAVVLTVHDLHRFAELTGVKRLIYRLLWVVLPARRANHITCVSEFAQSQLLAVVPGVSSKVTVIENPVGAGFEAVTETAPVPGRVLVIGTAPNKNIERVLAACAQVADAHLRVIGTLSEAQRDLAETSGVSVTDTGPVSDDQLIDEYRQASVLAFVSTAEGFGLPIIEAQACGVPVVSSNREPMVTVAAGGTRLVDPLSVTGIAAGIREALSNDATTKTLVSQGFVNVAGRSVAVVSQRYHAIYRRLLDEQIDTT